MTRLILRGRAALLGVALLAAFAAGPIGALLPAGLPLAAPTAAAATTTGLTMTADARYVVDPGGHRVRVAVALSATNHLADTKTRQFYFDRAFLVVQPDTSGFTISSAGAKPAVRVQSRTATYTLLRIDFDKQLGAGATRLFDLAFDIVDPGGAPTRTTRIGDSLVSFGAWGFGSTGTPGGSVTVVFPAGYAVDVAAPELKPASTDPAGNIVYTTGSLASPLTFFAYFVADRPSAFVETTIQVAIGDRTIPIVLRAWPDDPAWAKRVGSLLQAGLPALAADIGLPWTVDRPLIVAEAISRTGAGFAGRYSPTAGQIEIAYYATPFVILHEAAHAWFDGSLLSDRWSSEAFASYYAVRAAATIGLKDVTGDALTPDLEKSRVPLNAWSAAPGGDATVENAEHAAALKLAGLIAGRATSSGLTAVWQAIREQRAAYQPSVPSGGPESALGAPDWRGFLDLLEQQTGATYDDLWRTWVVRPAEATLLDQRTAARERYAAVVLRADSWALPRVVRDALRAWQFGLVSELLGGASAALDARDAVHAATAAAGLAAPDTMRAAFEGPRGFAAVSAEADAELSAVGAYRAAAAAKPDDPDLVVRIGLWNSDPAAALDQAATAFAAGDLRATVKSATFARRVWSNAAEIGRNRLVSLAAALAALILGTALVLRWRRDRRLRQQPIPVRLR